MISDWEDEARETFRHIITINTRRMDHDIEERKDSDYSCIVALHQCSYDVFMRSNQSKPVRDGVVGVVI